MSKEHTAAPWHGRVQSSGQGLVMAANGQNVAVVYDGEADTALIAAAPELLEAARRCVNVADTAANQTDDPEEAARFRADAALLRAAIRKAEGDAR